MLKIIRFLFIRSNLTKIISNRKITRSSVLRNWHKKELHTNQIIRTNQFIQSIMCDDIRRVVEQFFIFFWFSDRKILIHLSDEKMKEMIICINADNVFYRLAILFVRSHQTRTINAIFQQLLSRRTINSTKIWFIFYRFWCINKHWLIQM